MRSRTYVATPPGASIQEQLTMQGISEKEFARKMNMSIEESDKLIRGEQSITSELAIKLETILGVPAQFWCNLESIYQEKIQLINQENEQLRTIENTHI